MGIINKLIPNYTKDEYGRIKVNSVPEPVYIDDAFDPLFNKNAKAYLSAKYGNPLFSTLSGYTELIDNALLGQKDKYGILGPGMGILSSFGRTMDKAGDFVLGSLTEGVNALTHINPVGGDVEVTNPIEEIFVEDKDYTGNRLLAAIANNMAGLAGGTTVNETDFNGLWNIPSLGIELATDPSILGNSLAKRFAPAIKNMPSSQIIKQLGNSGVKSAVGEVGQLLSNYDDLMTRVAIDTTVPGLRPLLKETITKIRNLVSGASYDPYVDKILSNNEFDFPNINGDFTDDIVSDIPKYTDTPDVINSPPIKLESIRDELLQNPNQPLYQNPNLDLYNTMLDDFVDKFNITIDTDPEIFNEIKNLKNDIYNSIHKVKNITDANNLKITANKKIQDQALQDFQASVFEQDIKYSNQLKKAIEQTEAGKSLRLAGMSDTVDIYRKAYRKHPEDVIDFIDSLDGYSKGPGYEFDLSAYRNLDDGIDGYEVFINDLSNGYLKILDGDSEVFVDDSIVSSIDAKFDKLISNYGYVSPDVKVFMSPTDRRVSHADKAAKYINARLTDALLKSPNADSLKNFEDIVNFIKEDPDFIKFYDKLPNNIKKQFDRGLSNILNPSFKKGNKVLPNKITTYLKNTENFVNLIRRYLGGSILETSLNPFFRNLVDFADDVAKNIFEPLNLKYAEDFTGKSETLNVLSTSINPILRYNKQAFRDAMGDFDLKKFEEFYNAMPDLDVKISPSVSKQIFTPTEETDKIFNDIIERIKNRETYLFPKNYSFPSDMPYIKDAVIDAVGYYNASRLTTSEIKRIVNKLEQNKKGIFYGQDLLRFAVSGYKKHPEVPKIDLSTSVVNSLQELRKIELTPVTSEHFANRIEKIISKYNPEELAEKVIIPESPIQDVYKTIKEELFGNMDDAVKVFGDPESVILKTGTPEEKRLFTLIDKAEAVRPSIGQDNIPTLKIERVKNIINKFKNLMATQDLSGTEIPSAGRFTTKQVEDYLALKDALNPVITKKENFIQDLITSRGIAITVVSPKNTNLDNMVKAIENNIAVINSKGKEIVRGIFDKLPDGNIRIGYTFVPENLSIVKDINKLKIDTSRLKDIPWQIGRPLSSDEMARFVTYQPIDDLFKEAQEITQDLSTQLGFTEFTEDYFKHVMSDNPEGAEWLKNTLYKDIKIDDLSDLSDKMAQMLNLNKTFRIMPQTRSLKGNIIRFNYAAPVFSTDLEAIAKSSFAKGVFDNSNFQSYVDLFINDNFKIRDFAKNTEDLKRLFYSDEGIRLHGNTNNLVLAAPKFKEGKLVGFIRFDKFSEKGLQEALNNPETVLLPTNVLAPLDKILRKDAKMSNKVYAFINKYLTIPFKFGTLANPGFLVGNISDAYFKQAVSLSQKYGTPLHEELVNVAKSLRNVMIINNQFDDIYQKYITNVEMYGKKLPPHYKVSSSITQNKKAKDTFVDWLNSPDSNILTINERKKANLFMFLNNMQNTSVFKSNVQDLEDVSNTLNTSKYDIPTNPIQRILTGKGSYDGRKPSTWGLFANNPLSNKILSTSETIESYVRSASILNDLTHTYKGLDMIEILELNAAEDAKLVEKLNVDMANAINLMHHANFDYENMNNFMDAVSTIIPFPTFFLKNLGYWLEILVDNPQLIDHVISTQESLWRGRDISKDEFEAEAKGRGAIPLDFGQKLSNLFKGIYKTTPTASMFGAFGLLNNPLPNMSYRLHPALSPITHHLQDGEDIKYRPYSTNIYEKNIKLKDKKFNILKYLFHRLNPYERAINTGLRTPAKISKGKAQLSDFLPSIFQPDF